MAWFDGTPAIKGQLKIERSTTKGELKIKKKTKQMIGSERKLDEFRDRQAEFRNFSKNFPVQSQYRPLTEKQAMPGSKISH